MDEEQTYRKPCQNRGDDLLIEDKDFAVVYNGSVGGTYEVFLKHTEQEVRDHITRYGIGRASEDDRRRVFGIGAAKNADIPNAEWWFAEPAI